jgi:hypothetical protein
MIRSRAVVREVAGRIASAVDRVVDAYGKGRVEHEPAFTDRMLGAIEETMNGFEARGILWTAKTLTSQAPNAQETLHGADFAGVLSVSLPDFHVKKGFLAQAKRIEPDASIDAHEFERMKDQCELMLQRSTASFVFLYAKSGVRVVPAIAVVSSKRLNPHELYGRGISRFYEEHFECLIGDRRINRATPEMLDELQRDLSVRRALLLTATE